MAGLDIADMCPPLSSIRPRCAIMSPMAITRMPETCTNCRMAVCDNRLANSPNPNSGNKVPKPNINKNMPPWKASPLPAAGVGMQTDHAHALQLDEPFEFVELEHRHAELRVHARGAHVVVV